MIVTGCMPVSWVRTAPFVHFNEFIESSFDMAKTFRRIPVINIDKCHQITNLWLLVAERNRISWKCGT